MAIQEQITLSNPSFVSEDSFIRVVEKGRKKQEKELAHLGAVLRLVEKEIAEAKNGTNVNASENAKQSEGPSNTKFEDAMDSMVYALQMLQLLIARYGNQKAQQDEKISAAEIEAAQNALADMENDLKKIQEKEEDNKTANFWEHFAEAVLGGLTVLIGAILVQPELVVMGVLSAAAAAGAFKEAADHVVKPALLDTGMSKKAADITSSAIVCATTIALSVAACDPESAVEATAEETTQVTEETVEDTSEASLEVAEESEETTTSSTSTVQKVKSAIKNTKVAKLLAKVPARVRMGVFATITTISSTQLVQRIYEGLASANTSKKEREKAERIIGIVIAAVSLLLTIAVSFGATSGPAVSKSVALSATKVRLLSQGLGVAIFLGIAGTAAGQIAQGAITIQEGKIQKELFDHQASFQLLKTLLEMNSAETSQDQKQQASIEKNQQLGDKSLTQLMKGIEGFANVAAYYSPV